MCKPIYEIMETIKKKLVGHYNYSGINNRGLSMPIPHIKVNIG